MPTSPTDPVDGHTIVIGYGSLMSGYGLTMHDGRPFAGGFPVFLRNVRRGFGKLSRHGDRLAMVLEPTAADVAIQGFASTPGGAAPPTQGAVGALALHAGPEALLDLSRREGYPPTALRRLIATARSAGNRLSDFLWDTFEASGSRVAQFRTALVSITGETSPHYIPHPIALTDGRTAITFLAPGVEGTGRPDIIPVRIASRTTEILSLSEAWARKPNASQLDYFAACLLAQVHGILVDDLDASALPEDAASRLSARLVAERPEERRRLCERLGLDGSGYAAIFGRPARS